MSIMESIGKMFGQDSESPKNRPEDLEAARELADEDPVLGVSDERKEANKEVIDNIESNPQEEGDVGDILAERREALEENDRMVGASRKDSMVEHSKKEDNNE